MRLRLEEDPREWQKFTTAVVVMLSVVSFLLYRRHAISTRAIGISFLVLGLAMLLCLVLPRFFRGFYRVGMTAGFYLGQAVSMALLTVFFLGALTPLGLVLRLLGKDLLGLKKPPHAASYWHPAKTSREFDRSF